MRGKINDEQDAKELDKLKRLWEAGIWAALSQAVQYCAFYKIALPEWAAIAVLNVIQDRYQEGTITSDNGKVERIKFRGLTDYAHFLRWNAMKRAMHNNCVWDFPEKGSGKSAQGIHGKISLAALKNEALSYLDRPRALAGGVKGIEESYWIVEKSKQAGEHRFAFNDLTWLIE